MILHWSVIDMDVRSTSPQKLAHRGSRDHRSLSVKKVRLRPRLYVNPPTLNETAQYKRENYLVLQFIVDQFDDIFVDGREKKIELQVPARHISDVLSQLGQNRLPHPY